MTEQYNQSQSQTEDIDYKRKRLNTAKNTSTNKGNLISYKQVLSTTATTSNHFNQQSSNVMINTNKKDLKTSIFLEKDKKPKLEKSISIDVNSNQRKEGENENAEDHNEYKILGNSKENQKILGIKEKNKVLSKKFTYDNIKSYQNNQSNKNILQRSANISRSSKLTYLSIKTTEIKDECYDEEERRILLNSESNEISTNMNKLNSNINIIKKSRYSTKVLNSKQIQNQSQKKSISEFTVKPNRQSNLNYPNQVNYLNSNQTNTNQNNKKSYFKINTFHSNTSFKGSNKNLDQVLNLNQDAKKDEKKRKEDKSLFNSYSHKYKTKKILSSKDDNQNKKSLLGVNLKNKSFVNKSSNEINENENYQINKYIIKNNDIIIESDSKLYEETTPLDKRMIKKKQKKSENIKTEKEIKKNFTYKNFHINRSFTNILNKELINDKDKEKGIKTVINKLKLKDKENHTVCEEIFQNKKNFIRERTKSAFKKDHFDKFSSSISTMAENSNSIYKGKIDDYVFGKELGKGAYAVVKLSNHKPTNTQVAIKIYENSKLNDSLKRNALKREIEVMKKIDNLYIVKLFETIESSKQKYIIMEYISGISLLAYLKTKPDRRAGSKNSIYIFKQLVKAIEYCHKNNICHRDIKLENILIDENLSLKLIDFGFAAITHKTKYLNFFCGTPSYMPPEIVLKKDYLGFQADIWCLGILLYTLLCGCFPFRGNTEKDLYSNIVKGKYQLPEYLTEIEKDLLLYILKINPEERPSSELILKHRFFYQEGDLDFDDKEIEISNDKTNQLEKDNYDMIISNNDQLIQEESIILAGDVEKMIEINNDNLIDNEDLVNDTNIDMIENITN